MVKLGKIDVSSVSRRISSGDAGAPLTPPLTQQERTQGGRLEEFILITAQGDDGHNYQWTFPKGTVKANAKAAVTQWFANGKGAPVSPMINAIDEPPSEEWMV